MTLIELKAAAYDACAQIEAWTKKLQDLNQQIAATQTAPAVPTDPPA